MMTRYSRILTVSAALGALGACAPGGGGLDWDLRGIAGGQLSTSDAARQATEQRPRPDARGVIAYPGYQVALARRGDTVQSVADRLGMSGDELGRYNALKPNDLLREGEVIALPRRVDAAPIIGTAPQSGAITGGTIAPAPVEVTAIATTALDRVGTVKATPPASTTEQPGRHRVQRGETAYSIARTYGVSVQSLAEWNTLGSDLSLREGQYLLIPVLSASAEARAVGSEPVTAPGNGSPTPVPPSAAKPLPSEKTAPAASKPQNTPASPDLGATRTAASSSGYIMPVDGRIIRAFAKGKNEGIDIGATPGSPVKATTDGEVAVISMGTDQVPVLLLRHAGNVLSIYAGIDGITVKKGDKIKRGQTIAVVRKADPAFLHFEIRKGSEAVDPMTMLR